MSGKQERFIPFKGRVMCTIKEYCDGWDNVIHPLEKILDVTVSSYNPSISFYPKGEINSPSVQMPLWVVEKILKLQKQYDDVLSDFADFVYSLDETYREGHKTMLRKYGLYDE